MLVCFSCISFYNFKIFIFIFCCLLLRIPSLPWGFSNFSPDLNPSLLWTCDLVCQQLRTCFFLWQCGGGVAGAESGLLRGKGLQNTRLWTLGKMRVYLKCSTCSQSINQCLQFLCHARQLCIIAFLFLVLLFIVTSSNWNNPNQRHS